MTNEEKHKADVQFLIECLTKDLTVMLMNNYNFDADKALELVYTSNTYKKLENEATGLYYESYIYVFDYLTKELNLEYKEVIA